MHAAEKSWRTKWEKKQLCEKKWPTMWGLQRLGGRCMFYFNLVLYVPMLLVLAGSSWWYVEDGRSFKLRGELLGRNGKFEYTAFGRLELEAGAGRVWEKNTVGLAGAGAGGWSGVREKYCSAGGEMTSRTQWLTNKASEHLWPVHMHACV